MISLIFICLAAICNSIMDKISYHYDESIFHRFNEFYWNPSLSWRNKYRLGKLRFKFPIAWVANFLDAFHLFKSLMIVFLALAVILHKPMFGWHYDIVLIGCVWNLTFNLFFNKIWKANYNTDREMMAKKQN